MKLETLYKPYLKGFTSNLESYHSPITHKIFKGGATDLGMTISAPTDDNRKDLEDYFDYVLTCNVCNKHYGVDVGSDMDLKICPACYRKIKEKNKK